MKLIQLSLFDILKPETGPEPEKLTEISADVSRPNVTIYGAENRAIIELLSDDSSFDREKTMTSFEGLGVEVKSQTGLAGLHQARKENLAQFFTSLEVSKLIVDMLRIPATATVFDNSCGTGRLAWYLENPSLFTGIEVEHYAYQISRKIYPNAQLYNGSFLTFEIPDQSFDYVLLNPPFNLPLALSSLSLALHSQLKSQ